MAETPTLAELFARIVVALLGVLGLALAIGSCWGAP